jgi:hypothetical protein
VPVVLGYRRQEGRTGHVEAAPGSSAFTAADVGRSLRRERVRQGLSLRDVGVRTGISEDQLRAAEAGALQHPDQLATLKTVRRYADLLGLPGDRYALAILERWPTRGRPGTGPGVPVAPAHSAEPDPTGATAPAGGGRDAGAAAAATATLAWPSFDAPLDAPFDAPFDTVYDSPYDTAYDTGVTPAVPLFDTSSVVRRRKPPLALRSAVAVLAVAVLAGGALLAIHRIHPSWLGAFGLARATPGHRVLGSTAGGAPSSPNAGPRAAAGMSAATAGSPSGAKSLRADEVSTAAGTVDAGASPFTVVVSAVGGPSWVQVSSPATATPLFSGTIAPGTSRSFTAGTSAAVRLGSVAGRVAVRSRSGRLPAFAPPAAPYTLMIRP